MIVPPRLRASQAFGAPSISGNLDCQTIDLNLLDSREPGVHGQDAGTRLSLPPSRGTGQRWVLPGVAYAADSNSSGCIMKQCVNIDGSRQGPTGTVSEER